MDVSCFVTKLFNYSDFLNATKYYINMEILYFCKMSTILATFYYHNSLRKTTNYMSIIGKALTQMRFTLLLLLETQF